MFISVVAVCFFNTFAFGQPADDFPAPIAKVLNQIEDFVGKSYDWEFDPELPDSAMSVTGGHLLINPNMWAHYSPYAIFFVILHEVGHQQLGHLRPARGSRSQASWVSRDKETEADEFAAKKMVESGISAQKVLASARELFSGSPGNATHPPGDERIRNITKVLEE